MQSLNADVLGVQYVHTTISVRLADERKMPPSNELLSSAAIQRDMSASLTDFEHLSDVTLVCGELRQSAHKAIICSRCKFFEAMLSGRFAEAAQREVVIDSMSSEVLRRVVEYLYTGRVRQLDPPLLMDLLAAANMLELPRLVTLCEKELQPLLNADNVIAVWQAATYHQAKQLQEACVHAMIAHRDEVVTQSDYKKLVPSELKERVKQTNQQYLNAVTKYEAALEMRKKMRCFIYSEPTK